MIREVFLIANFPEGDPSDPSLWMCPNGMTWLDWQVEKIIALGRQPWLIIGGNGDQILFKTKSAHDLNLIYDTEVPSLWTGLWSAAHGASNAAFVLPIQAPVPEASVWNQMVQQSQIGQEPWYREKIALRPRSNEIWGFPLLLNSVALKAIAKMPIDSLAQIAELFRPVPLENPTGTSAFFTLRSPSEIQR
ncbi:MAG: hypothetical protein K2X47_00320 [Bdellovibrionales bacterium]|nr:hypothetical protein [Bdellovibrionales bacterium]